MKHKEWVLNEISRQIALESGIKRTVALGKRSQVIVRSEIEDAAEYLNSVQRAVSFSLAALEERRSVLRKELGSRASLREWAADLSSRAAGISRQALAAGRLTAIIRDLSEQLNRAAVGYTMMHATAFCVQDGETARLAMVSLKQLTPLIVQTSWLLPEVVALELSQIDGSIDPSVGRKAARTTHQAWATENLQRAGEA